MVRGRGVKYYQEVGTVWGVRVHRWAGGAEDSQVGR